MLLFGMHQQLLLVLAATGCLLRSCRAQLDECTVSTEPGFDYQVSAETDFTVHWTVDTTEETITFQVVYEGDAWVSLGFSEFNMAGADAVIGLPDENTVLEYDLTGYTLSSVIESSSQEIADQDISQVGSTTTLVFTRPLSPSDTDKFVLSAEEGVKASFIWARGVTNTLDFHEGNKGSLTVADLFCSTAVAKDDDDTVEATTEASCESSDADFEFEVTVADGLTLFWIVEGDSAVSVKAVYEGEGWLAIGFSDSGGMVGSDAVIGLPNEETALEYDMDNYGQPQEALEQETTNSSISQSGGVTTLTFVRPLEPVGDGKQILYLADETEWLFAWGGSDAFSKHTRKGSFDLSLTSCDITSTGGGGTKMEYAHAWLMVIGWSVCFPIGILFIRFSDNKDKVGFPRHRAFQTFGAALALAGFIIAVVFTENDGKEHFDHKHAAGGLLLTIVLVVHAVLAIFRPHAPALTQNLQKKMVPASPSFARQGWSLFHRLFGYVAVIWAAFQCFGGFSHLDVKDEWKYLYTALLVFFVAVFLLLSVLAFCKGRGTDKRNVREVPGPQQPVAVMGTGAH